MYRQDPGKIANDGTVAKVNTTLDGFNFFNVADGNYTNIMVAGEDTVTIPQVGFGLPTGNINTFSDAVCYEVGEILLFTKVGDNTSDPGNFTDYDIRCKVISSPSGGPNSVSPGTIQEPYVLEILSITSDIHPDDTRWYVRLETPESLF